MDNSFEFFPPKTPEGKAKLRATWQAARGSSSRGFSPCTFGAGGSTREGTLETVLEIRAAGHEAAPHLSCIASTRKDLAEQLERYRSNGIRHLVALRGDLPSGIAAAGELRYASELVGFVRETTGDWFRIEVACYPGIPSADAQRRRRCAQLQAQSGRRRGFGDHAVFLQRGRVFPLRRRGAPRRHRRSRSFPASCRSANFAQLARFSDACGAEIPRWMRIKLEGYRDDAASIRAFGLDVVSDLCRKLIDAGAPGLHFYTLNQAALSVEIWRRLGL